MTDSEEISRLIYRYGYLLDQADFEGIGDLLAHATFGSDRLGRAAIRGRQEIVDQFRRTSIPEGTEKTKQIYSNLLVDVDGDHASSLCNFVVFQATEKLPLQPIVCGRFEDSFERDAGGWRFADRYIVVDLMGDLSERLYEGTQPYS